VPDLLSAQIFHNIIAKSIREDALPAQVVVGTGQAQVTNQLILPSATVNFTGIAIRSIGLQNQNQWQQSWSVSAVTDVGDLQRLDALYRYARIKSFTICDFIKNYNRGVISSTTTTSLRISDKIADTFDRSETARLNDYAQYVQVAVPSTEVSSHKNEADNKNMKVQLSFGPPATLPLPPQNAAKACQDPSKFVTYSDLYPQQWPVPFPDKPFIWIAGTDAIPADVGAEFENMHELRAIYVNRKAFAQFQLWVLGATVNTSSAAQNLIPSVSPKGISGSTG
jgi:hypothetical protein